MNAATGLDSLLGESEPLSRCGIGWSFGDVPKSIQVLVRIEMLGERHGLISILRLKAQRHLARLAN
jgi:hypothetical protein